MTEATQVTQTDSDSRSKRIVVGHDGSGGAGEALRMALTLADLLQASVRLARAWSMTTAPRRPEWEFGYMPSFG
jgi:nucleotide-binding universal stress UspA family protein